MRLKEKAFLGYKLFNSSFTGLSIGILFTIYQPLDPSTYSLGGIVLATSMLVIAKFYEKLLNIKSFYYISLGVEYIMLLTLITFIIFQCIFYKAKILMSTKFILQLIENIQQFILRRICSNN